jgi:hypothetical protein
MLISRGARPGSDQWSASRHVNIGLGVRSFAGKLLEVAPPARFTSLIALSRLGWAIGRLGLAKQHG